MMSVHISSGLVLYQMTSDHNRSELGIQDHSNEQSSSKLVPKVVPLAVKTATSRQELGLLFHLYIAMLRTTGIKDHEMFSIIYEPVHGIIYKNSKKEKRVMRHLEIHKFCDATLNRVLEGLKSYNNDIKYGYVQKDLTKDEAEYLKLFKEEIEKRLKHRRQMRRWEMFVNGRPLGPRRERPE
ncbi:hypothetical protein Tco_0474986 [Tanacetum coccineum]